MGEHATAQTANLYEIKFKGHLDRSRVHLFEGMAMIQDPSGETILTGPLTDQAALHGVLSKIRDLGLPLLSVKCLSCDKEEKNG